MTLVNAPGSFRRSGRSGNGKDRIRRVGTQQYPGCRAGRRPERSGWKRKKGLCGYRAPDFSGGGISTVVKRKDVRARSRDAENRQAETGRFAAVVRPARVPGVRLAHTLRRIADAETRSCGSRKGGRSIHAGVNNSAKVVRKFDNRNFPNGKDRKTVEIHPLSVWWNGRMLILRAGTGRHGMAAWDETVRPAGKCGYACALRRILRMGSFSTPNNASPKMPPLILDEPSRRSTKMIGTSSMRIPSRQAEYFISIWNP